MQALTETYVYEPGSSDNMQALTEDYMELDNQEYQDAGKEDVQLKKNLCSRASTWRTLTRRRFMSTTRTTSGSMFTSCLHHVYVMSKSCLCHVYVMSTSCLCHVYVMLMSRLCHVHIRSVISMHVYACLRHVYVMSTSCLRHA